MGEAGGANVTPERLAGGRATLGVVRIGDAVRRPARPGAEFGRACLLHLERAGFPGAPRFLGTDEHGREMLSFVPGCVPGDLGRYDDAQLAAAAALLRAFHDATATMAAVAHAGATVACHNDWAPTNTVFADRLPVAMIDFDTARPGERLWDLGYSAFTWLDLGNADWSPAEQVRRLEVFATGYGMAECTPAGIAVHALARQSALAASTRSRGRPEVARWAARCAGWTALHLVERLCPSGYVPTPLSDAL